ncbi:MAG: putative membrane protein YdjX (TVP38/TMEM64 family) [Granulosicoccus sp.]|jgi:uncharacterized membrane protein YdjX (TVP38/TMEM64 family)
MNLHSFSSGRGASTVLLALLILIVVGTLVFKPSELIPAQEWGVALESKGGVGMLLFLVVGVLSTSIGLPRQLVAFIGGIAYGVVPGVLLSLCAAILGCYLTVNLSRWLFAAKVARRYPNVISKLQLFLKDDVFIKVLVLRLQPLGTNLLTNLCVGFTKISIRVFLIASAVGYVPQMLVFALLGSGIRVGSNVQLILSAVLLVISLLLGFLLYGRHRERVSGDV